MSVDAGETVDNVLAALERAEERADRLTAALEQIVNYRGGPFVKIPPERAMRYIARDGLQLKPRSDDERRFRDALAADQEQT